MGQIPFFEDRCYSILCTYQIYFVYSNSDQYLYSFGIFVVRAIFAVNIEQICMEVSVCSSFISMVFLDHTIFLLCLFMELSSCFL